MRLVQRLTCLVLAAALVLLSPGPQAWAAAVDAIPPLEAPRPVVPQFGPLGTGIVLPNVQISNVEVTNAALNALPQGAALAPVALEALPAAAAQPGRAASATASAAAPAFRKISTYPGVSRDSAQARFSLSEGVERVGRASAEQVPAAVAAIYEGGASERSAGSVAGAREGASFTVLQASKATAKKDKKGTPDSRDPRTDDGPDSRGGTLFAAAGLIGSTVVNLATTVVAFVPLLGSLILHEMGHAKAASMLGDDSPRADGRLSFTWEGLKTHIHPVGTVLLPLISMMSGMFPFGWANPVQARAGHTRRGMAFIAFAGPLVNIGLVGVGLVVGHALAAVGAPAVVMGAASLFVKANVVLAAFNLIPLFPLDGHWILRAALPSALAEKWDRFNNNAYRGWGDDGRSVLKKTLPYWPLVGLLVVGNATGVFAAAMTGLAHLIPLAMGVPGVALAGAALPAIAAAGLLVGQLRTAGVPTLNPDKPVTLESSADKPAELIVMLGESSGARLTSDLHLSNVDLSARSGVAQYAKTQQLMLAELAAAGISADALASYGATPIATYRRINAATIRVDASRAAELRAALEREGHKVFDNKRRRIIAPVPNEPQSDPALRNPVSMDEVLTLTKADSVHKIARERWGDPDEKTGFFRRLFGQAPAQTPIAVIDSGAQTAHPLLQRVKKVVNVTSGENKDDIGHGSWVTSMVLNYAKWNRNLTHYKTFEGGSATTDDILKALTAAGNDGNLVISNSWGDDEGDPNGPDSKMVAQLAKEGHVLVFAAGNAGPGANTIGSPAIVYYDAGGNALRVVSVAAAGRDKKIARFSSRGDRSPKTRDDMSVQPRPDATAIGSNVEGAWPDELGPDRVDGRKGPVKAISGTSMSTPDVAGAIALLCMLFGVTAKGDKLDAVARAVIETLEPTGQGHANEGRGFLNVEAAFKRLEEVLKPGYVPEDASREYARLLVDEKAYQARRAYVNASDGRYNEDLEPKLQAAADVRGKRMKELEARYPKLRKGWFR